MLEATIVTAQGREQELQRVPISLQVIDARLIEDTIRKWNLAGL